ncbi:MAG: alanine/glycine:cation symporter family protein [Planctomycetota bacterium]|jgi:AGCS family alanine or glycine:cation symporter
MRRRFHISAILLAPLLLGIVGLSPTAAFADVPQDEGAKSLSTDPDGESGSSQPAASANSEAEPGDWMDKVDQGFEKYVIESLELVLFFDFRTPRWLRTGLPAQATCDHPDNPHEYVFAETWPDQEFVVMLERVEGDASDVREGNLQGLATRTLVPSRQGPIIIRRLDDGAEIEIDNRLGAVLSRESADGTENLVAMEAWRADEMPIVVPCPHHDADVATGQSVPLVVLWLFGGAIFFTLKMGFINVRAFWHAIRVTKGDYDDPEDTGEVSHFQALASALSATVGLGNIAGVAIAVATGGPGAIFWLILGGLLGMSTKFAECTLGQMYRKVEPDGTVSGGPMHYLRDGLAELGWKRTGTVLAMLFAVVCMGGSFGGGCVFQVSQSLEQLRGHFSFLEEGQYPWVYGLVLAVLVGIVIIGGIRRIAATAEKIVPLMCTIYVLAALYILAVNHDKILPAFALIFQSAFTPKAIYGGVIGVMVIGIRRAAFSNEAGLGSASIAHAAAKTDEPVREGIVALLEPFIDTVVVCTMTGLVIVITGVYDNPAFSDYIQNDKGAPLTAEAFKTAIDWFPWVLTAAVCLFAYSTLISWSYYGERCWSRLFGRRTALIYKLMFLGFVVIGSIVTAKNLLNFSDFMILSMAFPNILGVAMLSGKVRRALSDYWRRLKAGEMDRD